MTTPGLRAAGFDLGGTLVEWAGITASNWSGYYAAAFDFARSALHLDPGSAAVARAISTLEKYNPRINPREIEYSARHVFSEATADWDLGSSSADDVALCFYRYFQKSLRVFPDARPVLSALSGRGIKVGILTNVATGMPEEIILEAVRALDCPVDCVLTSAAVGWRKPNTAGYFRLAGGLGVKVEACMFVGDEETDIVGANRAGMISVLIDRQGLGRDFGQACTVRSLDELLPQASPADSGV